MMAAIAAVERTDCAVVSDGPLGKSNSRMAQGGLQLPLPAEHSLQSFVDDIVRSARIDLDLELVRNFVTHVAPTVALLEGWGLDFDRDQDGRLVRRRAGGISEPRIVSVKDQIGPAIIKVLRSRMQESGVEPMANREVVAIDVRQHSFVLRLRDPKGEDSEIEARSVVVCTGGMTFHESQRRHQPTTNPENINHRMIDLLKALGLETVHAEFFQYQPFGIVGSQRDDIGKCVPESIVNYPVRILDRHRRVVGEPGQDRYALTQHMFELLASGDMVESDDGPGVWLTIGDVPESTLVGVFPKVHQYLERTGRLGQDILIYPFLHYHLGGFRITPRCASAIPGLFLAGEMTGGLHGRNRLMGNGITDSLVHGRIAGASAAEFVLH